MECDLVIIDGYLLIGNLKKVDFQDKICLSKIVTQSFPPRPTQAHNVMVKVHKSCD